MMTYYFPKLLIVALLLMLSILSAKADTVLPPPQISVVDQKERSSTPAITLGNFFQVSADIYRSKQPSKKDIQQLEALGIKTIINLRLIHSDRDIIANTSLHSIWIRMKAGNITDAKIVAILKAIKESPKPILIHCWHGSDRTGIAIAMYRIVFQNWSKEQAIDELMQPEYGHHYNYYANIIKYIRSVDIEAISMQVFNDS